jgi:hypothetical protein
MRRIPYLSQGYTDMDLETGALFVKTQILTLKKNFLLMKMMPLYEAQTQQRWFAERNI